MCLWWESDSLPPGLRSGIPPLSYDFAWGKLGAYDESRINDLMVCLGYSTAKLLVLMKSSHNASDAIAEF